MSEQAPLPGVEPSAAPSKYQMITELEIADVRRRIIEAGGDMEKADISLELMANVIYTFRMKANPMQENAEAVPKAAKGKKKGESSTGTKLTGEDANDFLS